jgi:hypothetical protein
MIALAIAILIGLITAAYGGERMACQVAPNDPVSSWHYRTKIPGYAPGIRDDKCWYIGKPMKPREELFWATEPMREIDPIRLPWEQEGRWRGAAPGWDHKE